MSWASPTSWDDRADVLQHLEGVVPYRFLFGPQRKPASLPGAVPVLTWAAAEEAIEQSLLQTA